MERCTGKPILSLCIKKAVFIEAGLPETVIRIHLLIRNNPNMHTNIPMIFVILMDS